jgi:hypothetical protein
MKGDVNVILFVTNVNPINLIQFLVTIEEGHF